MATFSGRTILVVDDEAVIVRTITRALMELDCRIIAAFDGERALELLATEKPDLVITDIRMPGMNGTELAARIKAEHPNVPVLLLSAYREPKNHNGDYFIAKPFDNDELLSAVRAHLESRMAGLSSGRSTEAPGRSESISAARARARRRRSGA